MIELPTTASLLRRTFTVLRSGFLPFLLLALIIQLPVLAWTFLEDVFIQAPLTGQEDDITLESYSQ